jgi:hypothetical protein
MGDMTIPSHAEFLDEIDRRFRTRFPDAPEHLDPQNSAHAEMIQWWRQAHDEVLYAWTDSVFFEYYPSAPKRLDPNDPADAAFVEYWNDIAAQIRDGQGGKYNWSAAADAAVVADEEPVTTGQDGSVGLEDRIDYIKTMLEGYVNVLVYTTLAPPTIEHVVKQIEVLRGLVKDRTFTTYDHWWRSAELDLHEYEDDDPTKGETASVKALTVEAKIDRATGVLDTHLAGWATAKGGGSFGYMSRATE